MFLLKDQMIELWLCRSPIEPSECSFTFPRVTFQQNDGDLAHCSSTNTKTDKCRMCILSARKTLCTSISSSRRWEKCSKQKDPSGEDSNRKRIDVSPVPTGGLNYSSDLRDIAADYEYAEYKPETVRQQNVETVTVRGRLTWPQTGQLGLELKEGNARQCSHVWTSPLL